MNLLQTNFSLDNVTILIEGNCTNKEYISKTKETSFIDNRTGDTKIYRKGQLENLRINENLCKEFTTITGSLTGFFNKGNNFNSISLNNLPEAYVELGSILGIEENKMLNAYFIAGKSNGFEYGVSFEVIQPPHLYINSLLKMKGKNNKSNYGGKGFDTTYFINKSYGFYFYDKGEELREKGFSLPENWENKNILRIEKRLKTGQALKALTGSKLYVRDIDRTKFKKACMANFMKSYKGITIEGVTSKENIATLTFEEMYMLNHPKEALKNLDLLLQEKKICKSSYYKKLKKLKELVSSSGSIKEELDSMLERIGNNF